jgi:hypothetical protein
MIISIQYDHIDTQCGWRQRRALSPFFSSLSLSLSLCFSYALSLSLSFFFSMDGSTEKKKKKWREILTIGFVLYIASITAHGLSCIYAWLFERCESVLFYADFLFLPTLSFFLCYSSFYLNNSSRVRYVSA